MIRQCSGFTSSGGLPHDVSHIKRLFGARFAPSPAYDNCFLASVILTRKCPRCPSCSVPRSSTKLERRDEEHRSTQKEMLDTIRSISGCRGSSLLVDGERGLEQTTASIQENSSIKLIKLRCRGWMRKNVGCDLLSLGSKEPGGCPKALLRFIVAQLVVDLGELL